MPGGRSQGRSLSRFNASPVERYHGLSETVEAGHSKKADSTKNRARQADRETVNHRIPNVRRYRFGQTKSGTTTNATEPATINAQKRKNESLASADGQNQKRHAMSKGVMRSAIRSIQGCFFTFSSSAKSGPYRTNEHFSPPDFIAKLQIQSETAASVLAIQGVLRHHVISRPTNFYYFLKGYLER